MASHGTRRFPSSCPSLSTFLRHVLHRNLSPMHHIYLFIPTSSRNAFSFCAMRPRIAIVHQIRLQEAFYRIIQSSGLKYPLKTGSHRHLQKSEEAFNAFRLEQRPAGRVFFPRAEALVHSGDLYSPDHDRSIPVRIARSAAMCFVYLAHRSSCKQKSSSSLRRRRGRDDSAREGKGQREYDDDNDDDDEFYRQVDRYVSVALDAG